MRGNYIFSFVIFCLIKSVLSMLPTNTLIFAGGEVRTKKAGVPEMVRSIPEKKNHLGIKVSAALWILFLWQQVTGTQWPKFPVAEHKCHQKVWTFAPWCWLPLANIENNDQRASLFVSDLTNVVTAPSPFPSLQNWGTTWSLTPVTGLSSAATVVAPLLAPPPSTTTSEPTLEKSPSSK